MIGLPNVDSLVDGFHKDMDRMNLRLESIERLLARLVQLHENNNEGEQ